MGKLIVLNHDEKEELGNWIYTYLQSLESQLSPYRDKWDRFLRQFKVRPIYENKTFPWEGCSNVVVPEIKTACHGVTSFVVDGVLSQKPLLRIKPYKKDLVEAANACEMWLEIFGRNVLKLRDYWVEHFPLFALLGTEVMKFHYKDLRTPFGPTLELEHVPLHRVVVAPSELTVSSARLIGNVVLKNIEWAIEAEEQGLIYKGSVEILKGQVDSQVFEYKVFSDQKQSRFSPLTIPIYDLFITYTSRDYKRVGEEWRVLYHAESNTILRIEEYKAESRPYIFVQYLPEDDSIFGSGVGDWAYDLQEALTTTVNQMIDNSTIRNLPIFKADIGTDAEEELFPGRIIRDPNFGAVATQDIHQSTIYIIQFLRRLIWFVVGINENALGMDSTIAKTRQTFSGQSLNVQRANARFSIHLYQFTKSLVEVAWKVLELVGERHPDEKLSLDKDLLQLLSDSEMTLGGVLSEEKEEILDTQVFSASSAISNRTLFSIEASTQWENAQVERQAMMIFSQIAERYMERIIQFSAQLAQLKQQPGTESIQKTLIEAWKSTNKIMEKVFSAFSQAEAKDLLIELEEVMNGFATQPLPAPGIPGEEDEGIGGQNPPTTNPGAQASLGGGFGVEGGLQGAFNMPGLSEQSGEE